MTLINGPETSVEFLRLKHLGTIDEVQNALEDPPFQSQLLAYASNSGALFAAINKHIKYVPATEFTTHLLKNKHDFQWTLNIDLSLDLTANISQIVLSKNEQIIYLTSGRSILYLHTSDFIDRKKPIKPFYVFEHACDIREIQSNPEHAEHLLLVVSTDGSLGCLDTRSNTMSFSSSQDITTATWSPKGKLLLGGTQDGRLLQYDLEGDIKRTFPCPSDLDSRWFEVNRILWLENFLYMVAYVHKENQEGPVYVFELSKQQDITQSIRFDDLCFKMLDRALSTSFLLLHAWPTAFKYLVLVATSHSPDIAVLAQDAESLAWSKWSLSESSRASMPLCARNDADTANAGMVWDMGSALALPQLQTSLYASTNHNTPSAPGPLLLFIDTSGGLSSYALLNEHAEARHPYPTLKLPVSNAAPSVLSAPFKLSSPSNRSTAVPTVVSTAASIPVPTVVPTVVPIVPLKTPIMPTTTFSLPTPPTATYTLPVPAPLPMKREGTLEEREKALGELLQQQLQQQVSLLEEEMKRWRRITQSTEETLQRAIFSRSTSSSDTEMDSQRVALRISALPQLKKEIRSLMSHWIVLEGRQVQLRLLLQRDPQRSLKDRAASLDSKTAQQRDSLLRQMRTVTTQLSRMRALLSSAELVKDKTPSACWLAVMESLRHATATVQSSLKEKQQCVERWVRALDQLSMEQEEHQSAVSEHVRSPTQRDVAWSPRQCIEGPLSPRQRDTLSKSQRARTTSVVKPQLQKSARNRAEYQQMLAERDVQSFMPTVIDNTRIQFTSPIQKVKALRVTDKVERVFTAVNEEKTVEKEEDVKETVSVVVPSVPPVVEVPLTTPSFMLSWQPQKETLVIPSSVVAETTVKETPQKTTVDETKEAMATQPWTMSSSFFESLSLTTQPTTESVVQPVENSLPHEDTAVDTVKTTPITAPTTIATDIATDIAAAPPSPSPPSPLLLSTPVESFWMGAVTTQQDVLVKEARPSTETTVTTSSPFTDMSTAQMSSMSTFSMTDTARWAETSSPAMTVSSLPSFPVLSSPVPAFSMGAGTVAFGQSTPMGATASAMAPAFGAPTVFGVTSPFGGGSGSFGQSSMSSPSTFGSLASPSIGSSMSSTGRVFGSAMGTGASATPSFGSVSSSPSFATTPQIFGQQQQGAVPSFGSLSAAQPKPKVTDLPKSFTQYRG